jgi:hypothetical protein
MIRDGLPLDEVDSYLLERAWLVDYANRVLHMPPARLASDLRSEMTRIGAAVERQGRLYATTPHRRIEPGWRRGPGFPAQWPSYDVDRDSGRSKPKS